MLSEISTLAQSGGQVGLPLRPGAGREAPLPPRSTQDNRDLAAPPQAMLLQATPELARLALAQVDALRQTSGARQGGAIALQAAHGYETALRQLGAVQATVRGIVDRIALLPVPGDLSLEASRMPPLGDGLHGDTPPAAPAPPGSAPKG